VSCRTGPSADVSAYVPITVWAADVLGLKPVMSEVALRDAAARPRA
jgi:hypothetical protein